jgi:hypothetical protein
VFACSAMAAKRSLRLLPAMADRGGRASARTRTLSSTIHTTQQSGVSLPIRTAWQVDDWCLRPDGPSSSGVQHRPSLMLLDASKRQLILIPRPDARPERIQVGSCSVLHSVHSLFSHCCCRPIVQMLRWQRAVATFNEPWPASLFFLKVHH